MKLLVDTHLLIWSSSVDEKVGRQRLSSETIAVINAPDSELLFSAASIWEIAIKANRPTRDFDVDPAVIRRRLLHRGYSEMAITGLHGAAVRLLPPIHKDPFDRLLIAQAIVEDALLLTSDKVVSTYPGPIRLV